MTSIERVHLVPYLHLVDDFLAGRMGGMDLVKRYQGRFQDEPALPDEAEYEVLNEFFCDLEDYLPEEYREPGYVSSDPPEIDEGELVRRAHATRDALRALIVAPYVKGGAPPPADGA